MRVQSARVAFRCYRYTLRSKRVRTWPYCRINVCVGLGTGGALSKSGILTASAASAKQADELAEMMSMLGVPYQA